MADFGQNVNDARTAAILNAGTEQNRLQQLALNAGNFANAAQGQQFSENTTAAQFAAAIQAQRNAQNAQAAQFANTAQQQQFGQNQALAQFASSPNAKTILFPVEATQLIGSVGGIGELVKSALGKDGK